MSNDGRTLAEALGRVGIRTMQHEFRPFTRVREVIGSLERHGYGTF